MVPELTKNAQKWSLTRLERGQTTPKLKKILNNYLKDSKIELLYIICKA